MEVTGAAPGPGPGPEPGPGRTGYTNGTRIERGWYTNGTRMELGFQKLRYLWRQIGSHSYYYFICSANPTIPCICCATQAHRVILCLCNWPIALARWGKLLLRVRRLLPLLPWLSTVIPSWSKPVTKPVGITTLVASVRCLPSRIGPHPVLSQSHILF
jgi:hypothetical protein